jgi:prophage antirepressor-like protein|nr:MAG TPA: repressor domain protein [Caudoviricetes sp.]
MKKTGWQITTQFGVKETTIINESGLYSLILSSKLPTAKQFKRWVTSEVLPSIRKNGGYIAGQEQMTPEELMAKALLVANKTLAERDARISELTVQNTIM